MSTIATKHHTTHDGISAPLFDTPPRKPPFGSEYWYSGFYDDIFDPETNGMPIEPMAFRGKPIRLVNEPGSVFYREAEPYFAKSPGIASIPTAAVLFARNRVGH